MHSALLNINNLRIAFPGPKRGLAAVEGLDLEIQAGEVLGLVGESGCGKTLTALSILGLLPPAGQVTRGKIFFHGENLLSSPAKRLRQVRGNEISMIFQEPMTSLNPVFNIGRQLSEQIRAHQKI